MTRPVIIIPSRYGSRRFPGKPLAQLCGKPLIRWVWERACSAKTAGRVLVATDDRRIAEAVASFGGEAVLTSSHHLTGTDRVAEAARGLEADLIVNLQGDEPLLSPDMIDDAVAPFLVESRLEMGTVKKEITEWKDLDDPNVVKVVTDSEGFALYFSRSPIPSVRPESRHDTFPVKTWFRHIGLYVYRREALMTLARWAPTPLEEAEKLEQLRALEHGMRIRVVETRSRSLGVDTEEDLKNAEALLRQEGGR